MIEIKNTVTKMKNVRKESLEGRYVRRNFPNKRLKKNGTEYSKTEKTTKGVICVMGKEEEKEQKQNLKQ